MIYYISNYDLLHGIAAMGAISLRLSHELETRLAREAALLGKSRSELAREALIRYLAQRERERFMEQVVAEARAGYRNKSIRAEVLAVSLDFRGAENETLSIAEKHAVAKRSTSGKNEKWWK